MKQTAHIEDWRIYSHPLDGAKCLDGLISEHPDQLANSWASYDRSQTSALISIDEKAGRAETRNTIYSLGQPYKVAETEHRRVEGGE